MNSKIEDNIGKFLMIAVFTVVMGREVVGLGTIFALRDQLDLWPLTLLSKVFALIFVGAVVYFTVIRHNPLSSAPGILPRLTAVGGTFAMMSLIAMPSQEIARPLQVLSTILVIVGTVLSIICLRRLGRSFSIMATARELVTSGPYDIVRHPLYAAELITIVGVVIAHGTLPSILVGAVWLLLQYQRARYEESVLRQAFPAYDDYAQRVPMMVPSLARLFQADAAKNATAKQQG
jgi:protein-S-isoprenylcysteine O-methyltransferase Ste14